MARMQFFRQRSVWWPTRAGWLTALLLVALPAGFFLRFGENWLGRSQPVYGADVLVVEGWIGIDGISAAKAEFERGGYRYVVTSGGDMTNRWGPDQWNYAEEAKLHLLRIGLPNTQIIAAPVHGKNAHRTFASALEVAQQLKRDHPETKAVNIFTYGTHARRSQLVYGKALPGFKVGVIAWTPPDHFDGRWWQSSERALDLIKETIGYLFELMVNSGRFSNADA